MPGPTKPTPPKEPEATTTPQETTKPTPEQERIKDLEDQLARALAKRQADEDEREVKALESEDRARYSLDAEGQPQKVDATEPGLAKPGNILIHFVSNGRTALGKVWVQGEELEIEPGTPEHEFTKDKFGRSWLDLDEGQQLDKYGEVVFRPGPWRGKSLAESKFEKLAALANEEGFDLPTAAELAAVERAARLKGRKPPQVSAR